MCQLLSDLNRYSFEIFDKYITTLIQGHWISGYRGTTCINNGLI